MKLVALLLLAAALHGCSSGMSTSKGGGVLSDLQDAREIDLLFSELETEEAALAKLLPELAGAPVDCARACDLRASIANLARRICAVTAGLPDRERQVQCVDARRRSEIAKANVKEVCACEK